MQSRLAAMQAVVFSRNLLITVQNISLEKLGVCTELSFVLLSFYLGFEIALSKFGC